MGVVPRFAQYDNLLGETVFYEMKNNSNPSLSRRGCALIVGFVAIISLLGFGITSMAGADTMPQPSKVISIQEKTCYDDDGAIHASGLAPATGNYALHVLGEDGNWHVVANQIAQQGEYVSLATTDHLVAGETVGVALTYVDHTLRDDSVEVQEFERRLISLPSATFCQAPIKPVS